MDCALGIAPFPPSRFGRKDRFGSRMNASCAFAVCTIAPNLRFSMASARSSTGNIRIRFQNEIGVSHLLPPRLLNYFGAYLITIFFNYERRSALPVHLPPCAVPRYMARSAENSAALSQSQRSARLARHRRSGGSIAGALPQMPSASIISSEEMGLSERL